jgi:hypothetical protein
MESITMERGARKMTTRYKFLRLSNEGQIRSRSGNCTWTIGAWQAIDGEVKLCKVGFHCSKRIWDAFSNVHGEILAEVEVDGDYVVDGNGDKEAWQRMRLVRCWRWRKADSVAFAVFAAELVLNNYEKLYPGDERPCKAIEAAKRVLEEDNEENRVAAQAAEEAAAAATREAEVAVAVWAAVAATWAARVAAVDPAKTAAWTAARSAARSVRVVMDSAAWSAESAAEAAQEELIEEIVQWMDERMNVLEPFE